MIKWAAIVATGSAGEPRAAEDDSNGRAAESDAAGAWSNEETADEGRGGRGGRVAEEAAEGGQ